MVGKMPNVSSLVTQKYASSCPGIAAPYYATLAEVHKASRLQKQLHENGGGGLNKYS